MTVVVHIFSEFAAGSCFYAIAELLMTLGNTVWLHPQLNGQDEDKHEARLAMQPHSKVILELGMGLWPLTRTTINVLLACCARLAMGMVASSGLCMCLC